MGKNYAVEKANNKCKQAIEQALLELLEELPYEKISISDITRKADVSRNAYYRNYDSKDSIVREYLHGIADSFFKDVTQTRTVDYYIRLFTYFKKYSKQLGLLYSAGLVRLTFEVFFTYSGFGHKYESFVPQGEIYAAGGVFFIALRWFGTGMVETPEELARIIYNIEHAVAENGQLGVSGER